MANTNLSIGGGASLTGYLHIRYRKVSDPGVVIDEEWIAPPVDDIINRTYVDLDPTTYFFDFYEAPDGVSLGVLLNTFTINAVDSKVLREYWYYVCGGDQDADPSPLDTSIVDADHLAGKNIVAFERRGMGKLRPDIEFSIDAEGITLLIEGDNFNIGEVLVIEVDNETPVTPPQNGFIKGWTEIDADYSLLSSDRGCVIYINSAGSRITATLELVSAVPDNTYYHFIHESGSAFQAIIKPGAGDAIRFLGFDKSRIVLGKGESVILVKQGTRWELMNVPQGMMCVGRECEGVDKTQPNTMLLDATLYNGDDYPRVWDWIQSLPGGYAVNDVTVGGGGWAPGAGKEGMWHFYDTGSVKSFRPPNAQNWFSRPLKKFDLTHDAQRAFDFPGATQLNQNKQHTHAVVGPDSRTYDQLLNMSVLGDTETVGSVNGIGAGTEPIVTKSHTMASNGGADGARPDNRGVFRFVSI